MIRPVVQYELDLLSRRMPALELVYDRPQLLRERARTKRPSVFLRPVHGMTKDHAAVVRRQEFACSTVQAHETPFFIDYEQRIPCAG
jgi:hypothetical protein